jgi:hypothetical protein
MPQHHGDERAPGAPVPVREGVDRFELRVRDRRLRDRRQPVAVAERGEVLSTVTGPPASCRAYAIASTLASTSLAVSSFASTPWARATSARRSRWGRL